jgi:hypothetical protein
MIELVFGLRKLPLVLKRFCTVLKRVHHKRT